MIKLPKLLRGRSGHDQAGRPFFDSDYYLSAYPDVGREKMDPYIHYLRHGWREGRDPSAVFSTLYYKDKYLAGSTRQINPLIHYAKLSPAKRGALATQPADDAVEVQRAVVAGEFDAEFYGEAAFLRSSTDALTHYLTKGWRQGLEPRPGFSSATYLERHPHVKRQGLNPFYHYLSTYPLQHRGSRPPSGSAGRAEVDLRGTPGGPAIVAHRAASPEERDLIATEFDAPFYLAKNADVRESGMDPLLHFVSHGVWENRSPNELFWVDYYRGRYGKTFDENLNPFFHFLSAGRALGYKPNPFGERLWPKVQAPEEPSWQVAKPAADISAAAVVLIMPVYKGYDDTLGAIHSVLSNSQDTAFALLVINDGSPDPRLSAELERLAGKGLFALLNNAENLGFVRTVNRGLDEAAGKDVVLLNADILVYGDWLDRLIRHAAADASVATVTPFSNNATICSYPSICIDNRLQLEAMPEKLDAYTAACNAGSSSLVPTGVGFCLYMRRAVIDAIGTFDAETFGRGYGEENDFCMRAAARGYRNLLAHDVFVFHSGSVSFGTLFEDNSRRIFAALLGKHPNYQVKVRNHIAADPAQEARRRLDLYRFTRRLTRMTALLVTHKGGGGIETHVQDLSRRLDADGFDVVIFRIAGPSLLDIAVPDDSPVDFPAELLPALSLSKDVTLLEELLRWIAPRFAHVHSFVKLNWDSTLTLMSLVERHCPAHFYTLHDYAAVCHRNHLVTPEEVYCGLPGDDVCRHCIRMDAQAPEYIEPMERRRRYGDFLGSARLVLAPSEDVAERVGSRIPLAKAAIRPHEETFDDVFWRSAPSRSASLTVAVVGAIGKHKGADILYSLALDARARDLAIDFMIVGHSYDTMEMRSVGIRETGRYTDDATAMQILNDEKADLVLLPSIWPETFSYTLSLALAAGVPPVVFDLGAPADRLRTLGQGQILDAGLAEDPKRLNDALLALDLDALWSRRQLPPVVRYDRFERDYYGLDAAETRASPGDAHSAFGP